MARNDTFIKILYAVCLALLPMVIFAYLFLPKWSMGLFIAGILLAKIWIELFKNKFNKAHIITSAITNILVFSTLFIFFIVKDLISTPLAITVVVTVWIYNILYIFMYTKNLPEIINAVDYCYTLFEILTLIAFTFLVFSNLLTNIGVYALLLTGIVSVVYKIYFAFRYFGIWQKFLRLFTHKK